MKPKESVHNILKGSRHPTKSKPRKAYRTRPMGASAIPHSPEEEQRDEVNRERAKSRKPSPRQPGKGGRVMWAIPECVLPESRTMLLHKTVGPTFSHPVLVLDLSDEARERRVEAIARVLAKDTVVTGWHNRPSVFRKLAARCAASLGDTPAEGRGK